MVSSAVRPLAVARGGFFSHDNEPGTEQSDGEVLPFRHQSPRRAVAPESQKLYDALSEKALRCAVGSHIRYRIRRNLNPIFRHLGTLLLEHSIYHGDLRGLATFL